MSTTFLSERMTKYFEESWIEEELSVLSNKHYHFLGKRKPGKTRTGFWNIIPKGDKWDKFIHFHFELRWTGEYFTEAPEITIRVHLESKASTEDRDKKAREYFENRGYVLEGDNIKKAGDQSLEQTIIPNFSSEAAAKDTIRKIITVLDSALYKKCAKTADEFIQKTKKEN